MDDDKSLELEIERIKSEYNLLATTMNMNQQSMLEKLNELIIEFKAIKKYLEEGIDSKIDERILINEAKKSQSMKKWLISIVCSSGVVSGILSWLATHI